MKLNETAPEVREAIAAQGYFSPVRLARIAGLNRVLDYCADLCKETQVKDALGKYYAHIKSRLIDDEITAYQFQNEVKTINFVQTYFRLENITGKKLHNPQISRYRQPTEYYRGLLTDYENAHIDVYTPATLSCTRASIRDFIFFLEDNGIENISTLTHGNISSYILALSEKYNYNIGMPLGG